jgi:hypothetical protein
LVFSLWLLVSRVSSLPFGHYCLVLALKIDVLPLQLKEDDTPAYLINAKHSGKYIDGNITLHSFLVLFTLPSWNGH